MGSVQVLVDGDATRDNPPPREQNQIYSVNSGTADLTTTSPSLPETTGRALLPTTNTILAYGFSNGASATPAGAEVFNPRCAPTPRRYPSDRACSGTPRTGAGLRAQERLRPEIINPRSIFDWNY